jgi:Zn-dependent protease with chaperone function
VIARALLALLLLVPAGAMAQSAAPAPPAAPSERVEVPEPSDKAIAYHRSGTVIWVFSTAWGLLVPFVILWTGFSARMRDWARAIGRKWFFMVAAYWVIFTLVTTLVDLPRAYYVGFVRQHAYDLSNQTLAKWASDQMANLAVTLVIGGIALWVPYLLLRKSPRRWWIYTSLAAVPFIVTIVLVQPLWIDPLFNRFGPMKDKALESDILLLAGRAGIEGGRVFEVAKSEDTKQINAYVNGFGATKRIVLWDTILAALDRRQILVVMGHEMGHYVLGHVWKLIVLLSLTILGMTYAVHRLAGALIRTRAARFGFTELGDVASLPLVLVLVGVISLVTDPLTLAVSRYFEHEADRFAAEITRDNHAAATAFVILQQENLAVPRPGRFYTWFRASHPPIGDRIDFFNDYRPWESGQPLVYGELFRPLRP